MAVTSSFVGSINRKIVIQVGPRVKQDTNSKIIKSKRLGNVAQLEQHLPSKFKVLSSNPITTTKNQTRVKGFVSKPYSLSRFEL
jgi:hypothetical protein